MVNNNVKLITDEYGNTWNEVTIDENRDNQNIVFQKPPQSNIHNQVADTNDLTQSTYNRELGNKIQSVLQQLYPEIQLTKTDGVLLSQGVRILGQADIEAGTVLIDAIWQKQDTLPHEYAHHYISWFKNATIVKEAIAKWGSEEALVQSIGEQVVKQKGEAFNWWNKFTNWLLGSAKEVSQLSKEQLTNILTDAFLTKQDLTMSDGSSTDLSMTGVNAKLETFLLQFGFTTEQLDSLQETTGYSIIGATDYLEKIVFVQKHNIESAYTREAAYIIFNLLGRKKHTTQRSNCIYTSYR